MNREAGNVNRESEYKKPKLNKMNYSYKVKSLLFGVAVGDALGVPVEFISREEIRED